VAMVAHRLTIWDHHECKRHHRYHRRITGHQSLDYETMLWVEQEVMELKIAKNIFFSVF
jgi:hypothetical protein